MNSLPFTYRRGLVFTPFSDTSNIDRLLMRIIMWTFLVDMVILPALILKLFFSPIVTPIDMTLESHTVTYGVATEYLMNNLKSSILTPVKAIREVKRPQFSVIGTLVTLDNDNIQIFEYSDHDRAMREATTFVQTLPTKRETLSWKKQKHVYVNGPLVIYYVGDQGSILTTLDRNAGVSITQPIQVLSAK